ncbi:hypothetical protein [Cellulomonas sp. P5_C6]
MVASPEDKADKSQIGLTPAADEYLKAISNEHFGGSQRDAYLFAIAYAVGAGLDLEEAPAGGFVTKFNALGTLESGSSLRDLLAILDVGEASRPFATAERLAELGVKAIAQRLAGSETLADILESVASIETQ